MENRRAKQVIVRRRDLKISENKMCAQAAHASLGALLKLMQQPIHTTVDDVPTEIRQLRIIKGSYLDKWLNGVFTKIVLFAETEEEMIEYHELAKCAGLPTVLITDAGFTEFKHPTNTCVGIGPYWSDEIDKITGHLPLK